MNQSDITEEIRRLSDLLRLYQRQYYVDAAPTVSDSEYDRLFDSLLNLEKKYPELREADSPTARVGSDLAGDFPEAEHSIPVLSLDKAYTSADIENWMERTLKNAGEDISFSAEEKIDGVSIVLYYEDGLLVRALTRGNGFTGNDVTANVKTIGAVPLRLSEPVTVAVRGEIYLPVDKFGLLNREMDPPYANPRNLAAGTLRRIKSSETARIPLEIFVYEGFFEDPPETHMAIIDRLSELGFRVNPSIIFFSSIADFSAYAESRTSERESLGYEIDGLVVKVNEISVRDRLGYTGHHPRWAIAYKFESSQGISVMKGIDIQVGRTGRITPVGRVEPVQIGGSTVSNVTLHNQEYIDMLELAPGDTVAISRRGDVIPAVEEVVEKGVEALPVWRMPGSCPSCGSALVKKGAHHFCVNRDCPDQIRGRIFFFVDRKQMDIENFGPETVEMLIKKGLLRDVQDIYTIPYEVLDDEKGFGPKKIALIRDGVRKSLKQPFVTVLSSLGIPELGKKAAELLISSGFTSIDLLYEAAGQGKSELFTSIHGIGEKTAEQIISGLNDPRMKEKIAALRAAGLNFEADPSEIRKSGGIFEGQSWCITGSFENFKPREAALEEIKKRGGRTVGSVTGSTTHLLCGEGGGSKKTKAEKTGAVIVSEEEFLKMIGEK